MIIEDSIGSFISNLYNRIVTPLSGAFIFSWLVWNFEVVMIIFSGAYIDKKIELIEAFYTYSAFPYTWLNHNLPELAHGVLFPLISTLFFIFIYPIPAKWAYRYNLKTKQELLELQREVNNEVRVTEEQYQSLVLKEANQAKELSLVIDMKELELKELREDLAKHKDSLSSLQGDLSKAKISSREARQRNDDLNNRLNRLLSSDESNFGIEHYIILIELSLASNLQHNREDLREIVKMSSVKFEKTVKDLVREDFIIEPEGRLQLARQGLINMGQTRQNAERLSELFTTRFKSKAPKQHIKLLSSTELGLDDKSFEVAWYCLIAEKAIHIDDHKSWTCTGYTAN